MKNNKHKDNIKNKNLNKMLCLIFSAIETRPHLFLTQVESNKTLLQDNSYKGRAFNENRMLHILNIDNLHIFKIMVLETIGHNQLLIIRYKILMLR